MAFTHGYLANILLDGFVATDYLSELSEEGEIDVAETTVFGHTAKQYVPGLEDSTVSFSGRFDSNTTDDTLSFSYKIDSLLRQETQATVMPRGDGLGELCYLVRGIVTSQSIEASVDDIAAVELEMQNTNGLQRGVVLHPLGSQTTTDTTTGTTPVDNSTASTKGATAVLHVTNVTGTGSPSLDVKVQHSTDENTWADLITFGSKTAKGSEFASATGTVNRYLKVIWTIDGTNPEFAFHVALHRK